MRLLPLKLAVSALALGYVAWRVPLGDAGAAIAGASLAWVALALALKALAVPASAEVWRHLLPPGLRPARSAAARTYFASLHAGLIGPGNLGGDAYRAASLGGRAKAPEGLAAVAGEHAVTLTALAIAAALGALLSPAAAPLRTPALGLAGLAVLALTFLAWRGPRLAVQVREGGFVRRTVREGLHGIARLRAAGPGIVLAAAAVPLLNAGSAWALFRAVGWPVDFTFALVAANAAALAVLLPISVQGLGVREGAFLALFTGLGGVPAASSLAASLLSLALAVGLGIAAGAALWWPRARAAPSPLAGLRGLALLPVLAASPYGSVGEALEKLLTIVRRLVAGLREEMTFLPPGAAPLVMIFGGLFVLALALALSLMAPRLHGNPRAIATGTSAPALLPLAAGGGVAPTATLPPLPANLVTPPPGAGRTYDDGFAVGKALTAGDLDAALDAAERMGLGMAHLVAVEPHRQIVRFAGCQSCRLRSMPGVGPPCDFERGFLEGAVRGYNPRAGVTEVFCSKASDGACEFEVRVGG